MNAQRPSPTNRREASIQFGAVIIVVLVLAALCYLLFPRIGSRPHRERSKAAVVIRSILNALKSYEVDHGHFPKVGQPRNASEKFVITGESTVGTSLGNEAIFDVLRAIPRGANANHALNPKKQIYFEEIKATNPQQPQDGFADGPEFAPEVQGRLFDPWGSQYCIVMETDDDGMLNLGSIYKDLADPDLELRYRVVAFSLGKDKAPGGPNYRGYFLEPNSTAAPDDIASWR